MNVTLLDFPIRLLLVLMSLLMLIGYGSLWKSKDKPFSFLEHLSKGTILSCLMLIAIGLAGLYNTTSMWIFMATGIVLFFRRLKEMSYLKNEASTFFKENLFLCLIMTPIISLMFIRASSPTYFIDSMKGTHAICQQYINFGGIRTISHNYFLMELTPYFIENLFLFGMIIHDEILGNMFVLLFSIFCFFQLKIILPLFKAQKSFGFLVILIAGNEIFFHSVAYSKKEIFLMFFLLELIRNIYTEEKNRSDYLYIGILISFLFLIKFSFVILIPVFLTIFFWKFRTKAISPKNILMVCFGSCFILCIWIVKNTLTHGFPLYPFIGGLNHLPPLTTDIPTTGVQLGLSFLPSINIDDFFTKAKDVISIVLFNEVPYNQFRPHLFFYILIASSFFIRERIHIFFIFCSICNFLIMTVLMPVPLSVIRYSFPGFLLWAISAGRSFSIVKNSSLRRIIFGMSLFSLAYVCYKQSTFLPGIRYHLGQKNLSEFYRSIGYHFTSFSTSHKVRELEKQGKLAVFAELDFSVRNKNAIWIKQSEVFNDSNIKSTSDFHRLLINNNIFHCLIELRDDEDKYAYCLTNGKWIQKCIKEDLLSVINEGPTHQLLKVSPPKINHYDE